MPELPSKLFFRIGEVASLVGVEPHVLRYWEREFRSIRPTKSAKGQRVYSRKDVENLLRVRDLLYRDGFTIAGAKKRLQRGPEAEAEAMTDGEGAAERLADSDGETDGAAPVMATAALAPGPIEPGNGRGAAHDGVRHKLSALRAEVETFLAELTPERRR